MSLELTVTPLVEMFLRHMTFLVVFLGHKDLGLVYLHLVEPHLIGW